MAQPKVFLSSTCGDDLNNERHAVENFLKERGFDVRRSENPDFGVSPGVNAIAACLEEVEDSDYFILIIGRDRGSDVPGSTLSVVETEYARAKELGLVVNIFVREKVWVRFGDFRKNPHGDYADAVMDNRVLGFVERVATSAIDNWVTSYRNTSDITERLTRQFGHYLKLYAKYLGRVGTRRFTPREMTFWADGTLATADVLATETRPPAEKDWPKML